MNPAPLTARLTFEAVTAGGTDYECGVESLRFSLAPGQLLWVTVPLTHTRTPLADLAGGLLEPADGVVRFEGADWRSLGPDTAAAARARIGRVFEQGGWVSNLDLDESIVLAARYHGKRPTPDLLVEAEALARELGQSALFRARPNFVSRPEQRRSQWVRALLGTPDLLLLERPTHDIPDEWRPPLAAAVTRALARGAAAIWISSDPGEAVELHLKPALQLRLREEKLVLH